MCSDGFIHHRYKLTQIAYLWSERGIFQQFIGDDVYLDRPHNAADCDEISMFMECTRCRQVVHAGKISGEVWTLFPEGNHA